MAPLPPGGGKVPYARGLGCAAVRYAASLAQTQDRRSRGSQSGLQGVGVPTVPCVGMLDDCKHRTFATTAIQSHRCRRQYAPGAQLQCNRPTGTILPTTFRAR